MDYIILILIGVVMGLFGGLLGIGGSIVMIPALIIFFREKAADQHLFQAAAMICNFFVATSALIVHRREKVLVPEILKFLVPAGIVTILLGVWLSNIPFFSGAKSSNLTKFFAFFMIFVAILNILKLHKSPGGSSGFDIDHVKTSKPKTIIIGAATGIYAGLLGLGGGAFCTPLQQLFYKMPLKRAIAHSTALIASMSLIGAVYKNATLPAHDHRIIDSLRIAVVVVPTAFIFSYIGSRLMHKLPKNVVRIAFIALLIIAAIKILAP